jgi:ATP-dependent DNA helicase RecG
MTAIKSKPLGDPHDPSRTISVRERLRALATPIQFLKGVGPKRAEQLQAAGLCTVEDLLYHLPFRYEDRRQPKKISAALLGQEETFVGELTASPKGRH